MSPSTTCPARSSYVDEELNIVFCNDRFAEVYPVPGELLEPGRSYPQLLRYLAEHGYYGDGDVDALLAKRVDSLRNPSGKSFEDRTPDGRIYRIGRRKVASGGTVTVMMDITELKEAEQGLLEAKQRAEEANKLVTEKNQMLESLSSKLSKYLSPQLYKSIFSGEKTVEVASQRKKLTIFFSDIAGFTETTDLLESEELTSLLNQYLREMSSIALEYGATIDKFIGDAIMLFFGDPETRGARDDAIACVKMAIAMQQRMRDLQAEWRERGQEHVFQLRIGINTGYCTVGNFGSADRIDYTVIGNEVNLAARLQSHADLGGILLAHETFSLVKDVVLTEETGTITVKGFPAPVRTHRVVGLHSDSGIEGRIIRQEQEGMLLIIDRKKLTGKGRADAIKALQDAASRLTSRPDSRVAATAPNHASVRPAATAGRGGASRPCGLAARARRDRLRSLRACCRLRVRAPSRVSLPRSSARRCDTSARPSCLPAPRREARHRTCRSSPCPAIASMRGRRHLG